MGTPLAVGVGLAEVLLGVVAVERCQGTLTFFDG